MHNPIPPLLVLDTNVVLDWLVFRDASSEPLGAALEAGRVRWHATDAMRDELATVLARGGFERWQPDTDRVLGHWDRFAIAAADAPPASGWTCADPDDQKFLDLAVHSRAVALLTRDRALRAFARRAGPLGLWIGPAAAWPGLPAG
jgi:predicted nucleic acid-binding protein